MQLSCLVHNNSRLNLHLNNLNNCENNERITCFNEKILEKILKLFKNVGAPYVIMHSVNFGMV